MMRTKCPCFTAMMLLAAVIANLSGCTGLNNYFSNGFKVGPNYCQPQAPVAEHWINQSDLKVEDNPNILCHWWTIFNDPRLNELINYAYRQNLTLKQAGCRILQARAALAIARGDMFPQSQYASGSYYRVATPNDPSMSSIASFSDQWQGGFTLNWELDFWGRFRRAVAAASADLDASVANYDGVIVTLLGDVASNYVQVRIDQERIRLLQYNIDHVQMEIWKRSRQRAGWDVESGQRMPGGSMVTDADASVAESTLQQTRASITQLELDKRQSENQLCILLGVPPTDIENLLGVAPIPTSPPEAVLDIPADLIRRRPDIRQAERVAASQSEEIGIATSDFYPAFYINGNLGYQASNFPDLFRSTSMSSSVGPSFNWDILNYGRIANNVRYNEAKFNELVLAYQQAVLTANKEVENGLFTFLQAQRRTKHLVAAVESQAKAVDITKARYLAGYGGESSFSTYTTYEQTLLTAQDSAAQAQGQICTGLIAVYRALGGGWAIRLTETGADANDGPNVLPPIMNPAEPVPAPAGAATVAPLPPPPQAPAVSP